MPRNVIVGHDALLQIPGIIADLNINGPIMLLSGDTTMKTVGAKVQDLLQEQGFDLVTGIVGRITYDEIKRIETVVQKAHAVLIVAVGGGRVIDTAKVVSYNLDIQFISVPTAASHDGIASSRASVVTEAGNVSVAAQPPLAIVADTGVIATAPHRLLAAGCADIIANYTAILDWELSHRLTGESISEYAVTLSKITAEILVKNANLIAHNDETAVWIVVKALFSSGIAMSIAGSSRPASGGEHKFAHMLERLAPGVALHGEACGIGTILGMYLHGGDWKSISQSLKQIGAPTTPSDLGISDEVCVQAVLRAREIRPERFTIFDTGITREAALAAVKALYEV
ncbi:3-dehydroquinate synthase [Methanocorpusculaceae archaeon Sp1]|uniref:Glycerol-1-phosphate dehydrogenase [NAD(P)+] n=2 Tax=Methanorbis furvi TaxID=3028299 RepID=A0AAE4MED6_9EURY|nr:3-dehydroquinate synthase [Methanocorpusculaceae archaeon Sp1]MDV0442223.1 3-dehydroquinate synthase [Methanocorpusculaceae archaeon Ag1]